MPVNADPYKVVAVSDIHGWFLPDIPECDLLLIAGDICPGNHDTGVMEQLRFLVGPFRKWLDEVPARTVAATFGNHDWIGRTPHLIPPDLRWTLLVDQTAVIDGYVVHGTPWSLPFGGYAYMEPEDRLVERYTAVPDNCDILISHGPPKGYGDRIPWDCANVGSVALLDCIQRATPQLVVCGHIHPSYGRWQVGATTVANVALPGKGDDMREPAVFQLRPPKRKAADEKLTAP
jgi:Icc-related predicted phosphoesterase